MGVNAVEAGLKRVVLGIRVWSRCCGIPFRKGVPTDVHAVQPTTHEAGPPTPAAPRVLTAADGSGDAVSPLQEDAAALLETIDAAEGQKKYERLSAGDRALIFQLHARDVPQGEIAKIVGCHASTVCRAVKLVDTREGARMILNSKAAEMAEHVIDKGDPEIHRKVLTQLDVLPDKGHGGASSFLVAIGVLTTEEQRRAIVPCVTVDGAVVPGDDRPDA